MKVKKNSTLKRFVHPYIFVLKEGGRIKEDFLDYSLQILQVGKPETIRSPSPPPTKPLPNTHAQLQPKSRSHDRI